MKKQRIAPKVYERIIPIALIALVVLIVILGLIVFAVLFGFWPA